MSLRVATTDDIEALAVVHVLAMPMDPNFSYLFPNISEYQDEYFDFTRDSITSVMSMSNDRSCTLLIEISDSSKLSEKRIVAFATWEQLNSPRASEQDLIGLSSNRVSEDEERSLARIWDHLPKTRWDAYIPAADRARFEVLEQKYGKRQLFLAEMVVHPDFQRRGFGKLLMQWGTQKAKQEKCAITTFASVPGRRLYESFGLREIGSFRTQVEGEDDYIDNPILAKDAPT